jgi:hypothetical protein
MNIHAQICYLSHWTTSFLVFWVFVVITLYTKVVHFSFGQRKNLLIFSWSSGFCRVAFIFRHPERGLGFLGGFATWREKGILIFRTWFRVFAGRHFRCRHPETDLGFLCDLATWREIRLLIFS